MIKNLNELITLAKSKPKKRLVVVFANDLHTIEAVYSAVQEGIVEATLTGIKENIAKFCGDHSMDINFFEIIEQENEMEAGLMCCDMINQGKAHLIMKGSISTDNYMRCILNKERGIMSSGALLTHVTCMEMLKLGKLLIVSDVAVIPYPNLEQKEKILKYLIGTAHKLGHEEPKVALIGPSEIPNRKISSSSDAMDLVEKAETGVFGKSIVAGPMGLDLAVDMEVVQIKKYFNPVAGNADAMLFPNIDAGNVFYKSATKLVGCESAAIVVGAKVPAVLTSRGDSAKSKLCSIALATVSTEA